MLDRSSIKPFGPAVESERFILYTTHHIALVDMAPYTGFSKGRCISPEASQLLDALEAEALQEADPNVPIAPVELPPPPPFSAVVGFDMAALLVQKLRNP